MNCVFCKEEKGEIKALYKDKIIYICRECLEEHLDLLGFDEDLDCWEFTDDDWYLKVYVRDLEEYQI